mmetsp:Transcript_39064/g.86901  ORF Transcript_39064/g.86901 Transcript_39064/m.86901 type:complete len:314 (-) Transcript_39064:563-1504(-)|eukprot:CAMPEP_0202894352 /NCGR_PEP_ID=MMETSP1392-20130828/3769_1 /ASSEMBLY_ACC=CAM_ASM_000868 /TAXON_ID=225041 /ORGANISM="Chlamydomonas chlamydogama, Strain SAG 11-48b" /LENGTH=313 /DNA_ID=CAMNT_0049579021 /DNA_START=192 /DNA_END=1133 /DNA_ORIENTATION=-
MRLTTLHKTPAHDEGVWSASWIPNSNRLLSGSVDESVKVWEDAQDGLKFVHTYQGHILGVVSVVSDSSGEIAASSALDSYIRVWSLADHSTLALIEAATTETWGIAFGPQQLSEGLNLAVAGGTRGAVVVWKVSRDETTMQAEMALPPAVEDKGKRERFVLSVAYSPDGRRLACGAMDGTVAVYDMGSGRVIGGLEGHYKPVRSLAFTPDSRTLLTACDDMHVNMYDVENAALIESFSGHESWVLSVAAHPGGGAFASGGSDSKVKLWDLGARACVQTLSDHTDQVWSVAFNQDGSRLASASDDKVVITYSYA